MVARRSTRGTEVGRSVVWLRQSMRVPAAGHRGRRRGRSQGGTEVGRRLALLQVGVRSKTTTSRAIDTACVAAAGSRRWIVGTMQALHQSHRAVRTDERRLTDRGWMGKLTRCRLGRGGCSCRRRCWLLWMAQRLHGRTGKQGVGEFECRGSVRRPTAGAGTPSSTPPAVSGRVSHRLLVGRVEVRGAHGVARVAGSGWEEFEFGSRSADWNPNGTGQGRVGWTGAERQRAQRATGRQWCVVDMCLLPFPECSVPPMQPRRHSTTAARVPPTGPDTPTSPCASVSPQARRPT